MSDLSSLFKALSDETRIRILNLLNRQDLCVCELVEILELPQPKVSKHIAKLRSINLVNTKRNEQYIYYSLNRDNNVYNNILESVFNNENQVLLNDIINMKNIGSFVCSR